MTERHPGYCTLCRSRCGSVTLVENGRMVGVEPRPGHPTGGALCAKGRAAPELVHSPRRLTRPLRRVGPKDGDAPRWREIGWDEALDEIAGRLLEIRAESGAEAVAFALTTFSGTPIVDSYDWVERFVRGFGSPNLIYAVEVCGWHKDYAHALTFGRGLGVPEYDKADLIVLWGHNPARTWLAQASRIAEARRRGARVVVIDPKPDGSGQQADLWLGLRPGSDAALAMGAIHHLITAKRYDDAFVRGWTDAPILVDEATGAPLRESDLVPGGDPDSYLVQHADGTLRPYDTRRPLADPASLRLDARTALARPDGSAVAAATVFALLAERARPYSVERVAALTWLDPAAIAAFYRMLEGGPRLAYYTWTGVGQHTNATMTERAIACLAALVGSCDDEGGNIWTVPPPANAINDLSLLPEGQKEKALGLAELPLGPPARGWITMRDFARAVQEREPYPVRALMSFGTNLAVSQIDTPRNLAALRALEFHVHADMFMNPTAECADIVLPVSMPWERDALRIGFEITQAAAETIEFRRRMLPPHGECRADYDIVTALATRMGMGDMFFGGDVEAGWNHQLAPLGITVDDLRARPHGLRVPQAFAYRKYAAPAVDGTVAGFATPSRRVELRSESLRAHGHDPLPDFVEPADGPAMPGSLPLVLTTAKSGWYVHTSHRHVASLRRKAPDPVVEISPALAAARGLTPGDWARIRTATGTVRLRVRLNPALDARAVIAEFGWWEACEPLGRDGAPATGPGTSNINAVLSDARRDPVSGSVPLRAVTCDIEPEEGGPSRTWAGTRPFRVTAIRPEGADTVALSLAAADGAALPDFLPGQHVVLRLPGHEAARAYSLTGTARDPRDLSIAVRWDAGLPRGSAASLSRRIQELRPGDAVLLEAPSGLFTIPVRSTRPILLLANGIGITPFAGYLESVAAAQPRPSHPIHLLHGCRSGREHPLAGRLDALALALPTLTRLTAYSRPSEEDRRAGRFQQEGRLDLAAIAELIPHRPLAYLCGSPAFTAAMTAALVGLGVPRFDIFAESFSAATTIPEDLAPRTVTVAGAARSFVWTPAAGSLLDAALAAGIALPSGCRVGQCESCVVRVVEGRCAHLVPFEDEADQCLTCQAVPVTDLVLAP
ncbi:2Fe-2S iron-sulfur cluster binding domain-containing protein [Methylobacterium terricola]|uniref:2Fe-2S iron-sulfur cluster binding domain-containing protein n=1 Tax=Methylobacterium terricola TaxID=2583531 RepID=A0A5C4LLE8_9HYPH|nr:molybdopterin-dependent oxidoreductase [Methylobacterium terricola]TNC14495.1 2Fe-2S iron-sulfur cluster binding domain-containing protein [Methylobacterium terricola]